MSNFKLEDRGGGKFALGGRMAFDTAGQILFDSEELFEEHTRIEVDLSGVNHTDSAGLALLLEWITWTPFDNDCSVSWVCTGDDTLVEKWLPPACR